MRCVIYCRVSSVRQGKERTVESQCQSIRAFALENDWEVVDEFIDDGFSGSTLDRPALDNLRDIVDAQGVDTILVSSPDRLRRSIVLQSLVLEPDSSGDEHQDGPGSARS